MDFGAADPEFIEAVRHALYAERLGPVLTDLEGIQAADMSDLKPEAKGRVAAAKLEAAKHIPSIRAALMLDD